MSTVMSIFTQECICVHHCCNHNGSSADVHVHVHEHKQIKGRHSAGGNKFPAYEPQWG